jgi:hypothetical protein
VNEILKLVPNFSGVGTDDGVSSQIKFSGQHQQFQKECESGSNSSKNGRIKQKIFLNAPFSQVPSAGAS